MAPQDILDYWYSAQIKSHWFSSTPGLDQEIRDRFEGLWQQAAAGDLESWKETPEGCLALVILLDQMPLNMFRGTPESFSTEQMAVAVALFATERGFDQRLPLEHLPFLFMPLMHSENLSHQNQSVALFAQHGLQDFLKFAHHHRDIVRKFGRFPHRNSILGRESTPDELAYLDSDEAFRG